MKILKLRFMNLNSLYGEWSVDFTRPDYLDQGLFAITGPTGSGKSTLLDAICLALYGATPRLGRITKSGNEIMSRQTGACFAEVTFSAQSGTYRCFWEQHRAYKRPDGVLAEATHEISDVSTGQVLENRKREVALLIEEKTGMDFDRFTRSILLAQGGFAAFLQASPDERAPVLEQITGTGIYSEISRQVHERQRSEQQRLQQLRAELSGIACLDEADVKRLQADLEQKQMQERQLAGRQEQVRQALQWLDNCDALRREQQRLLTQQAEAEKDQLAFQSSRQRLERAGQALEAEGSYRTFAALRSQQETDEKAWQQKQIQRPVLEKQRESSRLARDQAEQEAVQVRQQQQNEQPLLKEVRVLDGQIGQATAQLRSLQREGRALDSQIVQDQEHLTAIGTLETQNSEALEHLRRYQEQHEADAQLVSRLGVIRNQAAACLTLRERLAQNHLQAEQAGKALGHADQQLTSARRAVERLKKTAADIQQQLAASQKKWDELLAGRLLREYQDEHSARLKTMGLLQKIASLEAERLRLQDGQPCPLCGALDHPFARGQVPALDEEQQAIERLEVVLAKARELDETQRRLADMERRAAGPLADAERQAMQAEHARQIAQAEQDRLSREAETLTVQSEAARNMLSGELGPFVPAGRVDFDALDDLLEKLAARLNTWQMTQEQFRDLERKAQKLVTDRSARQAALEAHQENRHAQNGKQLEQQTIWQQLTDRRRALYGDKRPDEEEARLGQAAAGAESAAQAARQVFDQAEKELDKCQTQIAGLKDEIEQRLPALRAARADFTRALDQAGLRDEAEFLACRLRDAERKALAEQARQLDERRQELKTRWADTSQKLAAEEKKALWSESREAADTQYAQLNREYQALHEEIGAIKQQLTDHDAAQERVRAKREQIGRQEQVCRRWSRLHELIGSADGKKYRNFVQGLTFERMVAQANRQLSQMSDRYLLVRDPELPLELSVIDNYQAGEIRSTKNLSGGESFIVSLALALGLSRLASRNVRVDSLFLDEGFGTLDEETLETALDTLASLQQDGKLIGVISHVQALKERIRIQLAVQPVSGGRSRLAGPGVSGGAPEGV